MQEDEDKVRDLEMEYDCEPTPQEAACLVRQVTIDAEVRFTTQRLSLDYADGGHQVANLWEASLNPARTYIIYVGRTSKTRWEAPLMDYIQAGGACIVVSQQNIEDIIHIAKVKMMMRQQYAVYETNSTKGQAIFILAKTPILNVMNKRQAEELVQARRRRNWMTPKGDEYAQHPHESDRWIPSDAREAKMLRYRFAHSWAEEQRRSQSRREYLEMEVERNDAIE